VDEKKNTTTIVAQMTKAELREIIETVGDRTFGVLVDKSAGLVYSLT
jgi:hypothetical protein